MDFLSLASPFSRHPDNSNRYRRLRLEGRTKYPYTRKHNATPHRRGPSMCLLPALNTFGRYKVSTSPKCHLQSLRRWQCYYKLTKFSPNSQTICLFSPPTIYPSPHPLHAPARYFVEIKANIWKKSYEIFGYCQNILTFAPRYRTYHTYGLMAEWLGRGLQNLVQRFESASDLQSVTFG